MNEYDTDLAYIHDVGFGDFARSAAPDLLKMLRDNGIDEGLVVDLGCGSGIWIRELLDAEYDALGVELSAAMIGLARERAAKAEILQESFLKARLPRCETVTALGECFNYLFDEDNGLQALAELFRRIYAALHPGGLLIFDIAEPGRGQGAAPKRFQGDDWEIRVEVSEDPISSTLIRHITGSRKVGLERRPIHEIHRLRLYRRSDVLAVLDEVGFKVEVLAGYGGFRLPESTAGFLAVRP